jgi:hypothetical protein
MKLFLRIVVLFLVVYFLHGCQNQLKETWNLGNTCVLPCWNGVIVGSTTKPELTKTLRELPVIDQDNTIIDGESWKFFSGRSFFNFRYFEIHGVAYYLGDKIDKITFSGNLSTSFGDMEELVGAPEFIISIPLLRPTTHNVVTAIYPSKGIAFNYNTSTLPKRLQNEISPKIPLENISFFNPEIYDEMINSGLFGQGFLSGEETLENLRPWVGYGSLNELYPPASNY